MSGAFFPDSFYTCGSEQVSETIHWPPFLKAAVTYHRGKYPATSREGGELKAFLYGVFTHQIMDSSWHSINLEEGLLTYIAQTEFGGDAERAHQYIDTAGDFLLLRKLSDRSYFKQNWEYPNWNDIHEILQRLGYSLNRPMLQYCTRRGESALKAEIGVIESGALMYTKISPLMDDVLDSYYLGGLQEVTDTIIRCLPHFDDWFKNGASQDPWELCTAIPKPPLVTAAALNINIQQHGTIVSTYSALSQFGHAISLGDYLGEPSVAISGLTDAKLGSVYVLPLSEYVSSAHVPIKLQPPTLISQVRTVHPRHQFQFQSRFGTALSHFKVFDITYLLVTEPGTSSIHIFHESSLVLSIRDFAANSRLGLGAKHHEGLAITTHDLNGDGIPEIILTAPMNDVEGARMRGEVFVLDGKEVLTALLHGQTGQLMDLRLLNFTTWSLPYGYQHNGYEQFGASIGITKDHVFIGASGLGVVFMFDHRQTLLGVIERDHVNQPVDRQSSAQSGLFGSTIFGGYFYGGEYVLIGSHLQTFGSCVSCGAVYLYKIHDNEITFWTKIKLDRTSDNSYAKFGTQIAVHEGMVYISAQEYQGGGALFSVKLSQVFGEPNEILLDGDALLRGERYTGFGKSLAVGYDKIFIGEPLFGYDELYDDEKKLMGRVGIYEIP